VARTRRNLIPGQIEIFGGAAIVAVVATVYLVRGGPDITVAQPERPSALRSPADGGPQPAPMRASGKTRRTADHLAPLDADADADADADDHQRD